MPRDVGAVRSDRTGGLAPRTPRLERLHHGRGPGSADRRGEDRSTGDSAWWRRTRLPSGTAGQTGAGARPAGAGPGAGSIGRALETDDTVGILLIHGLTDATEFLR